jgi:hypothetical protein
MEIELPFIDEFEAIVDAPPPRVFATLASVVGRSFAGPFGRAFTALLGCRHRGVNYTVPPRTGQELNGFRVADVTAPSTLVLEGQHRFASYRLAFLVEAEAEGVAGNRSRLRARTDALFPGVTGAIYRTCVIGSGGHAWIAKRMLRAIARRAERDQTPRLAP